MVLPMSPSGMLISMLRSWQRLSDWSTAWR
jgi:hypothetical protein